MELHQLLRSSNVATRHVAQPEWKPPTPTEGAAVAQRTSGAARLLAADATSSHVHQLQIETLHHKIG